MDVLKVSALAGLLTFRTCKNSTEPKPQANAAPDHTVSRGGVMHKSGLADAATNCVSCHGADLRGGTDKVSCRRCHGKKWQ